MPNWYQEVSTILLDLVDPFIRKQRDRFSHWHYLSEPDSCRGQELFKEIRLRFEGSADNLERIKYELEGDLEVFSERTHLTMKVNEPLGSHEGCHGRRNNQYKGAESEDLRFGRDFPVMVEVWQKGSEFAIDCLREGRKLVEVYPNQFVHRSSPTEHPRYLHYPANQLLLEP
jgi:hypothetical protein